MDAGTRPSEFAFTVSSITGTSGAGFRIPRGRVARRGPPSETPISRPRPAGNATAALLDRIIGTRRDGQPLILRGLSWVPQLADAVGVPTGIELLPRRLDRAGRPGFSDFTATGLPLRDVLQTLSALDAGFEWREMEGVIVFRPVDAWTDADDPLFRLVNKVRLDDVPTSEAIRVVASLLDSPARRGAPFPDSRRITALSREA